MRVRFSTVEEFLEELQLEVNASSLVPGGVVRLTCTYMPVQGQALRATVIAGVLLHQQLIELQHDCGTVWDIPGAADERKAGGKPADAQTNAKVSAVMNAVTQFAMAHGLAVRRGIFAS